MVSLESQAQKVMAGLPKIGKTIAKSDKLCYDKGK